MTLLITGGCGGIGHHLVRALAGHGDIRVIDDMSRASPDRKVPGVHYIQGDIRDYGSVRAACDGVDTVWHLAARNGTKHFYSSPADVLDIQVRGTLTLLDAMRSAGARELILFSSSEVYGQAEEVPTPEWAPLTVPDVTNPRYSYGGGKIAAELMCWHAEDIERLTIVRPHNVYGPGMGYLHVIPELIMRLDRTREHGTIEVANPTHSRAFCYVDDFVSGALTAWRKGSARDVFHVGTEEEIEMGDLAMLIANTMGTRRLAVSVKPGAIGGPRRRCPDTRKLRGLGWSPMVRLEEGLARTVEAYLAERDEWPAEAA